MSTVIYKNGRLTADTKAYGGDHSPSPGAKNKVFYLDDGSIVGIVSPVLGTAERIVRWFNSDSDEMSCPPDNFSAILVHQNGEVFLARDALYFSGPIECEYYAIGSGSKYALGALASGANAEDAILAASLFDPHTGSDTTSVELGDDDE